VGSRGDAAGIADIGFAACLMKPVKQSQLYDCLTAVSGTGIPGGAARHRPIAHRPSVPRRRKRRPRVLLAEDHPTNQKVALHILEKLGYLADAVTNGRQVIEALEDRPYDLVLMDLQMPEMDGFEATRAVRDAQSPVRNREIPIIALTAHAMKGDRNRCLETGMNDYVPKPIQPQELADVIERHLPADPPTENAPPTRTTASIPTGVFDRGALLGRLDGDEDLCREVVRVFVEDAPRRIEGLKRALREGRAHTVEREAHSIKGAASNVGARAVSRAARELETWARDRGLDGSITLADRLEREIEDFVSALPDGYAGEPITEGS